MPNEHAIVFPVRRNSSEGDICIDVKYYLQQQALFKYGYTTANRVQYIQICGKWNKPPAASIAGRIAKYMRSYLYTGHVLSFVSIPTNHKTITVLLTRNNLQNTGRLADLTANGYPNIRTGGHAQRGGGGWVWGLGVRVEKAPNRLLKANRVMLKKNRLVSHPGG